MKHIIVTGSTSGFGLLTAQTLATAGHHVFATMRNVNGSNAAAAKQLLDWAKAKNLKLQVVELDVANAASSKKAIETIAAATGGKIDVLINNAGISFTGVTETLTDEQVTRIFEVNILGAERLIRGVLPYMHKQKEGLIVNLTSVLARNHAPLLTIYNSTKAALDALAVGYHYELKSSGIDVVIVQPGAYPTTDIVNKGIQADNPAAAANYGADMTAFGKGLGLLFTPKENDPHPQEVADIIAGLVAAPKGQRPLWTISDHSVLKDGVAQINGITQALVEGSLQALSQA